MSSEGPPLDAPNIHGAGSDRMPGKTSCSTSGQAHSRVAPNLVVSMEFGCECNPFLISGPYRPGADGEQDWQLISVAGIKRPHPVRLDGE